MTKLPTPLAFALAAMVITAAGFDIATRRIPNPLVVAGCVAGVGLQCWLHGFSGLKDSGLGFLLGFFVFLPLFLLNGKGGGDVKLMAAVGAIVGPVNCFLIFILTAIYGGVMAIGLLLWRGGLVQAFVNIGHILTSLGRGKRPDEERPDLSIDSPTAVKLPYAVPIALGCLVFLSL